MVFVPGVFFKMILTPIFMWLGWKAPLWTACYMKMRRTRKFEVQFVDGLTLVANAVRAGLSLQQAFEMASLEMPNPFGEEFAHVLAEVRIGKTLESALSDMAARIGLEDVKIFVRAVSILRETGGNIIETLQTITSTIRERQKVHGKIKVLTTQGITQGAIILLMPFALAVALYFLVPEYIMPLFTTNLGFVLIFVALCLQAVGTVLMKKIVMIRV
jgi:tight adherence protein B